MTTKSNWGYSYARGLTVHKLDLYFSRMSNEIRRAFPALEFSRFCAVAKGKTVRVYYDTRQFEKFAETITTTTRYDAKQGTNHIKQLIGDYEKELEKGKSFFEKDFSACSSDELIHDFKTFYQVISRFLPILLGALVIELDLFVSAHEILAEHYKGDELSKAKDVVLTPRKPIPVIELELDALRNDVQPEILLAKYRWLGMRFVDNRPPTVKTLKRHLENIRRNAKQSYQNLKDDFVNREKKFNATIAVFSQEKQRFLTLVNDYSLLRHQRDTLRGTAFYYGAPLYREISKRYKVPMDDLFTYTCKEVLSLIKNNAQLSARERTQRGQHYIYLLEQEKVTIVSDKKRFETIKAEQFPEDSTAGTNVVGQTAYKGFAKGTVRLIRFDSLERDLNAFQQGEIMIAESTKPEYVPAMKRAAAIVTDEGGITSHAAIIAREFGIPCIVGTKYATRIFKNGDRVEVNANNGVIIRL